METTAYKDEIFSKRVRAGKRTYFFDVKATKSEKDFYITITESKKVGDTEFQKHKIFLYKEDFEKFADALAEAVDFVHDEFSKSSDGHSESDALAAAVAEEKSVEEVHETQYV
ncbi:MAG TPA: DUF3276 family protein [Bacteroidota bacterium]|nr:DUF3276 family protein [Bacteroidota bacterium]